MIDSKKIEDSYEWCRKLASEHYENFPVGSILVPKARRKYIHAIYAFARTADDIADSEELSSEDKLDQLSCLSRDLELCYEAQFDKIEPSHSEFLYALYDTKEALNIPIIEFSNLLKAFSQDAVKDRYEKFEELIEYSSYSANPIGHLVLYIFNYSPEGHPHIFKLSDNICTALQLTNFWQDVSVDLKIDRVYIPLEVMKKHGYSEQDLLIDSENDNFRNLMKDLVDRTYKLFNEGRDITKLVSGRLKLELKATYNGGTSILKKIEDINYNVLTTRVKLSKPDLIKLLIRTVL